jgi:hypothetical protein
MSTPGTIQVNEFPPTGSVANSDIFYSQNVNTGQEQKTTALQIQQYVQAPIANSTLTAVPSLNGTETFPLGKAGLFQTTLTKIAQFVLNPIATAGSAAAASLTGTEVFPFSQAGGLVQTTLSQIATYVLGSLAPQRQSMAVLLAGQTTYQSNGYVVGLVNVYVGGLRLNTNQYQALDGVHIVITDPNVINLLNPGMTVDIDAAESIAVSGVATPGQVAAMDPENQPPIGALTGTEIVSTRQGGALYQTTFNKLATWIVQSFQGFTQNGVNAISRTLFSKAQDELSVLDFGIPGGSSANNDSPMVQAAINAAIATGRQLKIPGGVQLWIGTPLVVQSVNNFRMVGEGPTSSLSAMPSFAGNVLVVQDCADCTFQGFNIDGNTTFLPVGIQVLRTGASTGTTAAMARLNFIDVYFNKNQGAIALTQCIRFDDSSSSPNNESENLIERCTFARFSNDGIYFANYNCLQNVIMNCNWINPINTNTVRAIRIVANSLNVAGAGGGSFLCSGAKFAICGGLASTFTGLDSNGNMRYLFDIQGTLLHDISISNCTGEDNVGVINVVEENPANNGPVRIAFENFHLKGGVNGNTVNASVANSGNTLALDMVNCSFNVGRSGLVSIGSNVIFSETNVTTSITNYTGTGALFLNNPMPINGTTDIASTLSFNGLSLGNAGAGSFTYGGNPLITSGSPVAFVSANGAMLIGSQNLEIYDPTGTNGTTKYQQGGLIWNNDTQLVRDGSSDTLAQQRGANQQMFHSYYSYSSSTSWTRLEVGWSGTQARIRTNYSGSGANYPLGLGVSGATNWEITTAGFFIPYQDITYDLGASSNRVRNIFRGGLECETGEVVTSNPTSGSTITIAQETPVIIINISATLAALTFSLPTPYSDGHKISFILMAGITAITWSGGTVTGAPASTSAYSTFKLRWNAALGQWLASA